LFTELDQWFSFEGGNIVSNNLAWTTKYGHDIFKKDNDYLMGGTPCRNGIYPLGEIISGSKNPPILTTRGWVDFSNEVKTLLLKRSRNHHRFQRKIFELLLSKKILAFDASSNLCININKKAIPEITSSKDLIRCGPPKMMAPTQSIMKIIYGPLGLLWI
jgi:hypothetical protein